MTNLQILEKAIKKAIEGGWNKETTSLPLMTYTEGYYLTSGEGEFDIKDLYPLIIFSHNFAKALWGEGLVYEAQNEQSETETPSWQRHLQMMVIDPDPIAYLGRNL